MQRSNGLPACASCKHQRKKCTDKCILAPFFPVEKNREFQAVHKIFGVSNVAKILRSHNSEEERKRAADSLIWEAFAWQRDPIQGPSGEFRRVVEELKFYKTQYQKITSQLPPTSQVTRSMGYKPAVNAAVASPVLVNGAWNNACNNNANINGGISTMMNNIRGGLSGNGGGLSGAHDHPNGNSIIDHSSNLFAYGANSNHLVVQTMEHQNGSAAVILSQQHPNGNSNGVLQGFEHQNGSAAVILSQQHPNGNSNGVLHGFEHQNGTAAVMLPQQHHTISGFDQQYYIPTGQYNSSTDVNGKTAERSPWHGKS